MDETSGKRILIVDTDAAHTAELTGFLGDKDYAVRNAASHQGALAAVQDWFGAERPGRTYLVLVQGSPIEDHFEIDLAKAEQERRALLDDLQQQASTRKAKP